MRTSLPKWGTATILLTIAILSNKYKWNIYLHKGDDKMYCERLQQKPWFQQLDSLLFHHWLWTTMNTTHDNESSGHRVSMNMAINMNYFIQREGRGASPHPVMSLTFLIYDVNNHKSNLWMSVFLLFFYSFSISNFSFSFRALPEEIQQLEIRTRKNFHKPNN